MQLTKLFRAEDLLVDFGPGDKWEAITRMLDHLCETGSIPAEAAEAAEAPSAATTKAAAWASRIRLTFPAGRTSLEQLGVRSRVRVPCPNDYQEVPQPKDMPRLCCTKNSLADFNGSRWTITVTWCGHNSITD